jgi:hypothetical protein
MWILGEFELWLPILLWFRICLCKEFDNMFRNKMEFELGAFHTTAVGWANKEF